MDQIITDLSDLRKYRTELPNLYDDLGLDVYEFRLLAHYKRVGICTESVRTTAHKCHMATGSVTNARTGLVEKGLITVQEVPVLNGISYKINVVDRWLENFARYSKRNIAEIKAALDAIANTPAPSGDIYRHYEQEIGPLTPMIADAIKAAEQDYPAEWISEAISLAAKNNKRNWRYAEAILKRWDTEGKDEGTKPAKRTAVKSKAAGISPLDQYL